MDHGRRHDSSAGCIEATVERPRNAAGELRLFVQCSPVEGRQGMPYEPAKDQKELFANNKQRNGGSYFNDVALHNFLKNNNLHVLIRGHEMAQNGIHFPFAKSNECITVFSSSKYNNNNQGAVLIIEGPEISSKKFMPLQDSSWKPTFPPWLIQEETRSSSDVSDDGISAMMEDFLVPNIFGLVQ